MDVGQASAVRSSERVVIGFVALVLSAFVSIWAGCGSSADASADDAGTDGLAAPADDGGAQSDASGDGGLDAATEGGDADAVSPDDAGQWSFVDIAQGNGDAHGYEGSAFDGRYLYLVPRQSGLVARFDTQKPFRSLAAWSFLDIANVPLTPGADGGAKDAGFVGAIFDGKYVYFVPASNPLAFNSLVARYDTTAVFEQLDSWRVFDLENVSSSASGFLGGVFDGRFVYFVPNGNAGGESGVVVRYDTRAAFDVAASYQAFDVATVDPLLRGFFGGVFDGKYVYLVPFTPASVRSGLVARYDTTATFNVKASWQTFDTTAVDPGAKGFNGGMFDGRYVYLVPGNNDQPDGILARYDTQAAFGAKASWSTLDVSATNARAKGFVGGAFDGRFLFLSPFSAVLGTRTDVVVSYDTTGSFVDAGDGDSGAVTTFPLTSLDQNAKGYAGGGFDGRYVYFTPYFGSIVARYDAHRPAALPPHLGSFL